MTEREYQAALQYLPYVLEAREKYGIQSHLIYGVMSRESRCGLALDKNGKGDNGHGHGLMQIDDRSHAKFIRSGKWKDPRENILYGVYVLVWGIDYMRRAGVADYLRAGIACYNRGPKVLSDIRAGLDCDAKTTGGNYSTDVLQRAEWFRARLFPPVEKIEPVPVLPPEIIPTHKELTLR